MQMQERLPGCGFCRLAASARDDESIQGRERVAAVLPVAQISECW
jgi:hypothetical protein